LERNWGFFVILKEEDGSTRKYPAALHNLIYARSVHEAFTNTFDEALTYYEHYERKGLELSNQRRREWLEECSGEIIGVRIGYHAKEGSALITGDLDDCRDPETGELDDRAVSVLMFAEGGYVEVSTSGTGLRFLQPREDGDAERFVSNAEVGGVGIFAKGGKGVALTFDVLDNFDTITRDESVLTELEGLREAARGEKLKSHRSGLSPSAEVEALHYGWKDPVVFCERLKETPNPQNIDFSVWYGLVLAAREHFSLQPSVDMHALGEALAEWSLRWESDENDNDDSKFWELWDDRPLKDAGDGRTTMGSWEKLMPRPAPVPANDMGFRLPREEGEVLARWGLVGGEYFDLVANRWARQEAIVRMTANVKLTEVSPKGTKAIGPGVEQRATWLRRNLRQFEGLVFAPGRPEIVEGEWQEASTGQWIKSPGTALVNVYRPLRIPDTQAGVEPYLDLVRRCYPDGADMILDWLAWQLQRPGEKPGYALVLQGPEGNGKDTIFAPVLIAMGDQGAGNMPFDRVMDRFNGWLGNKLLVVFQEAHEDKKIVKKDAAERIKTLITDQVGGIVIEDKHGAVRTIANVLNVAFTTNNLDGLHIGPTDRRYAVAATEELPPESYFEQLWAWLDDGGLGAVTAWLARRDISHMRPGLRAPDTAGKRQMQAASIPFMEEIGDFVARLSFTSTKQVNEELLKKPFESDNLASLWDAPPFRGEPGGRKVGMIIADALKANGFREIKIDGDPRGRFKKVHRVFARSGANPGPKELTLALERGDRKAQSILKSV